MTLGPLTKRTTAPGATGDTDEPDLGAWLPHRGHRHHTACRAAGAFARDEAGDGSCGVHVHTAAGSWSLPRSWLRPHRGSAQERLPWGLGFFEVVHNVRRRGKA